MNVKECSCNVINHDIVSGGKACVGVALYYVYSLSHQRTLKLPLLNYKDMQERVGRFCHA